METKNKQTRLLLGKSLGMEEAVAGRAELGKKIEMDVEGLLATNTK